MRKAKLTKHLSFPVTEGMHNKIKTLSDHENISMGHLIRIALYYALENDSAWRNSLLKKSKLMTFAGVDVIGFDIMVKNNEKEGIEND